MAQALVDPRRGTVHDVVPTVNDKFDVAPPLMWKTIRQGLVGKRVKYDVQTDTFEEIVPPPRPPVVIDPTPGTLDVVQFLIDEGIVNRGKLNSARPEWAKLLDNRQNPRRE